MAVGCPGNARQSVVRIGSRLEQTVPLLISRPDGRAGGRSENSPIPSPPQRLQQPRATARLIIRDRDAEHLPLPDHHEQSSSSLLPYFTAPPSNRTTTSSSTGSIRSMPALSPLNTSYCITPKSPKFRFSVRDAGVYLL